MSTESISSDSPLQVPQLIEDQLSEEELEMVAGGVLDMVNRPNKPTPASGGSGHLLIPNGAPPPPVGNQSVPEYNKFKS